MDESGYDPANALDRAGADGGFQCRFVVVNCERVAGDPCPPDLPRFRPESAIANSSNQVLTGSAPDFAYDAAGNMIQDATTGNHYTYDPENRITGAGGFNYVYDADGNRVEKISSGSSPSGTLYWYMSPGVVAESDLKGNLTSEYVFFNGKRVARKDFSSSSPSVSYYFSDFLESANVVTDPAGNIKSESDFFSSGGELQITNNDSNKYRYTGHEQDGESGLYDYGARHYSPALGRFITPDYIGYGLDPVPVPWADLKNPQSLNFYGYSRNNPTSLAIPTATTAFCKRGPVTPRRTLRFLLEPAITSKLEMDRPRPSLMEQ